MSDAQSEPVDGVEVAIRTEKSDGSQTEAVGTTRGGAVVFGMVTTAFGPNTIHITDVALPDCTWSPSGDTSLTWDAQP